MVRLPRRKKYSKKSNIKLPKQILADLNQHQKSDDGYVCIPASELRKHHDYIELSNFVQDELNELIAEHETPSESKKSPQLHGMSTSNKRRPSPYIVNLRKKTTHHHENHEDITETTEVNVLVFPKEDIDTQFTPLLEEVSQKNSNKTINKQKRTYIKGFIFVFIFLVLGQLLFSYNQLRKTQDYILDLTQEAFSNITHGYNALRENNYSNANVHFSMATRQFIDAEKELSHINPITKNLISYIPGLGAQFTSGYESIQAGSRLSLTAKYLTQGLQTIKDEPVFTNKIEEIKDISVKSLPLISESIDHMNNVDLRFVPKDKQDIFVKLRDQLPVAALGTQNFINISDFLLETVGHTEKKRYLIPFQNNAELRSSGGFIGSFALIDIYQGRITNIEVPNTGSYQLQGGLQKNIIPPRPLQLIADRWEFQDSNWDADFPTAAEQIENLFTLSWGPSVDGVIAVNLPVMENLLGILGPVELPQYEKTLTGENFWQEVQRAVEVEYDKELNNPKQIITDMTPIVLDRIMNSDTKQMFNLLMLANQSLIEKDIQLYMKDKDNQELIETYGWSGHIPQTSGDYAYVVNNNIAGGKTDRVIRQTLFHSTKIQENGDIINTVKIKREHTGEKKDEFTGIRNVSYVRLYVPQGSEFISATGWNTPDDKYFKDPIKGSVPDPHTKLVEDSSTVFKPSDTTISQEYGKTVFGNWSMIDPGETAEIIIEYKLPFKFRFITNENGERQKVKDYSLLLQKQPGTNSMVYSTIELPDGMKFADEQGQRDNLFTNQFHLTQDKKYFLQIKEK